MTTNGGATDGPKTCQEISPATEKDAVARQLAVARDGYDEQQLVAVVGRDSNTPIYLRNILPLYAPWKNDNLVTQSHNPAYKHLEPLPINAPLPLVCWRISSRLPLFAGWLSHRLLSRRLRLALHFVAQPPLASILNPRSSLLHHIFLHRLCLLTRCRLTCCLLWHLRLTSAGSPSLAKPFLSPPLSALRPLPASSNARRTLPTAA